MIAVVRRILDVKVFPELFVVEVRIVLQLANKSSDGDGVRPRNWDQNESDENVPEDEEERKSHLAEKIRLTNLQRNFDWNEK